MRVFYIVHSACCILHFGTQALRHRGERMRPRGGRPLRRRHERPALRLYRPRRLPRQALRRPLHGRGQARARPPHNPRRRAVLAGTPGGAPHPRQGPRHARRDRRRRAGRDARRRRASRAFRRRLLRPRLRLRAAHAGPFASGRLRLRRRPRHHLARQLDGAPAPPSAPHAEAAPVAGGEVARGEDVRPRHEAQHQPDGLHQVRPAQEVLQGPSRLVRAGRRVPDEPLAPLGLHFQPRNAGGALPRNRRSARRQPRNPRNLRRRRRRLPLLRVRKVPRPFRDLPRPRRYARPLGAVRPPGEHRRRTLRQEVPAGALQLPRLRQSPADVAEPEVRPQRRRRRRRALAQPRPPRRLQRALLLPPRRGRRDVRPRHGPLRLGLPRQLRRLHHPLPPAPHLRADGPLLPRPRRARRPRAARLPARRRDGRAQDVALREAPLEPRPGRGRPHRQVVRRRLRQGRPLREGVRRPPRTRATPPALDVVRLLRPRHGPLPHGRGLHQALRLADEGRAGHARRRTPPPPRAPRALRHPRPRPLPLRRHGGGRALHEVQASLLRLVLRRMEHGRLRRILRRPLHGARRGPRLLDDARPVVPPLPQPDERPRRRHLAPHQRDRRRQGAGPHRRPHADPRNRSGRHGVRPLLRLARGIRRQDLDEPRPRRNRIHAARRRGGAVVRLRDGPHGGLRPPRPRRELHRNLPALLHERQTAEAYP